MSKPKLLSVCFKSAKEARGWANSFYGSYNQQDIPTITHLSSKPAVWRLNIPESVQEPGYTFFTAEGRYPLKAVGFNHEIIAQRDGLTFGNLTAETAETAERIGFDAAPPSTDIYQVLVDNVPMFTSSNAPDAKKQADEMAALYATMNPKSKVLAIGIASDALGIPGRPPIHTRDSDCTIDPQTGCCTVCGVEHREPCPDCGHTAFHSAGCWLTRDIPSAALPSETTEDK